MRWLFQQCDLQLSPYENEGFSLPPFEAALSGLSTVFAEDPAMLETTEGNGLILPMATWRQPDIAVGLIANYLGSSQSQTHRDALAQKAQALFHPDLIGGQVRDIVTL